MLRECLCNVRAVLSEGESDKANTSEAKLMEV